MKIILLTLFVFFLFGNADAQVIQQKQLNTQVQVQTTPVFPAGSEKLFNESMKLISARHAIWIKNTAQKVNEKKLTDEDVKAEATSWAVLGSLPGADIEALAFLVLMQAAKSSQEDLKTIMAKVKAINNAKAQQRKNLAEAQELQAAASNKTAGETISGGDEFKKTYVVERRRADSLKRLAGIQVSNSKLYKTPTTKATLDRLVDEMKSDLDSMSEMGEMESLRLQMAMDRMSKMMSTLSNLLKKISDTAQGITQNLK